MKIWTVVEVVDLLKPKYAMLLQASIKSDCEDQKQCTWQYMHLSQKDANEEIRGEQIA